MDKGYLVVFDDAENYNAKAYDIDSDMKEDDAKKLAIEDYTFYKFIEDNKVIYFTDKKIWNTYLKKLLDFLKAKQSEINEFQSSSFKDKQLEVITEKIKLIESVKNIEAIEVTDVNILEKINATPLFRIDIKEKEFENDPVFSYHTFIFPFRIIDKSNGIKRKEHDFSAYNTKEILEKEISIANDSVWKKSENYSSKESITRDEVRKQTKILDEKLFKLRYNEAQYFNDAPLRAIFGFYDQDEKQVVTNYVFNHDLIHEKAKLIIQVASENEPKEYQLLLNDIKLKLFNTDVAMMIFEAENHDYPDIKDIKLINEYVRRISTPNLTIESNPCAYYWEIKFKDANDINVCLKDDCYDALNGDLENINTTKIVDSIKQLLLYPYNINENSRKDVCLSSSVKKLNKEENKNKKLYLIEPVLDDRMFVCTFIKNDAVINKVKNKYVEINGKYEELKKEEKKSKEKKEPKPLFVNYKYGYQIDEEVAKELYSIVYIDATTSSCQSMHDIQTLLSRDLYTRWIDYGTLYASTHHSFVAISTSDCPGYLIDYFLTLYVDMTILTLIQRATIIVYQNYASLLTKGIEADKKKINQAKLNTLLNLHEKYIGFQNQLLFFEVSPEEQGMELYQMLVKSLYINEEKDALAEQFKSLYDVTNANQNSTFSKYAAIMASIALVFTSITFIYDMFEIPKDMCIRVGTVVIAIIIILGIICYVKNKYRRNK